MINSKTKRTIAVKLEIKQRKVPGFIKLSRFKKIQILLKWKGNRNNENQLHYLRKDPL